MRKYFTWRCIALHLITLVLVPSFVLAGWWQYHVAEGGNDLSWVYTVEWPAFSVYAIYMWWALIHDKRTPFDKLWAAKARVAADAEGIPLYQIPGWATDKALARAVTEASFEAARELSASSTAPAEALASSDHPLPLAPHGSTAPLRPSPPALIELTGIDPAGAVGADQPGAVAASGDTRSVIDAEVVEVKVVVDEELEAYNRYLADLNWKDPPKRWGTSKRNKVSGSREARRVDRVDEGVA